MTAKNVIQNGKAAPQPESKTKRRRYRPEDPDFVAPDGGWGWLIVLACGFSNLSNFPMFQQFGLIFRERFETLGISNAETTTIINMNSCFNACVGLFNGPVFRKFTYRKVALFGASLVACSLFLTVFCNSFWSYMIFYAALYGSGIGITQTSNSIALNTYFKKKRRKATGFSWGCTGLGPIVWPYIITFLMGQFGMTGTVLIFSAFATHSVMCSLLLQPVHWHTPYRDEEVGDSAKDPLLTQKPEQDQLGILTPNQKSRSAFQSQYLVAEEERLSIGYEVPETGTPYMLKANDGLYSQMGSLANSRYGSRLSLTSNKGKPPRSTVGSGQNSLSVSTRPSYVNLQELRDRESKKKIRNQTARPVIEESAKEDCPTEKALHDLKDHEKHLMPVTDDHLKLPPNEKDVLKSAAKILYAYKEHEEQEQEAREAHDKKPLEKSNTQPNIKIMEGSNNPNPDKKPETNGTVVSKPEEELSGWQKFVKFFDLGLLKDPMYLNLMLGITIANFAELNFSILTPFVLKEFNFEPYQIATFMSLLGALDIIVRFLSPFFADKLKLENKTYFLIGVLMMAGGRIILVHTQDYLTSIFVAMIIGAGKGLRTIFMALVIPSYVPLDRLPAACGLQLVTSGLLFLLLGPVVGWIRDAVDNYVITLHILNITTYITTVAWTIEPFITRYYKNKKTKSKEVDVKVNN